MLIAALLAASPVARGADPALDSPEQKVLDRWVGAWKSSYKVLESPWTPEERALTADVSSKRAVGGRFVEEHTVFDIPTTIASLSEGLTLEAGDLILTGTPAGVGFARKPPEFLQDGDVVECEVERIGLLRNTVRTRGSR
jgi:2-keto-4-pentenoate hydratase/2-oxohepta-3-ene-1,7-dioic acid hydratase in catechol pathway